VRSCQTSLSDVAGKKITTIEGLSAKGDHPLQKRGSPSRFRNAATVNPDRSCSGSPALQERQSDQDEVVAHMDGNLCRCMTYSRIQKAIMRCGLRNAHRVHFYRAEGNMNTHVKITKDIVDREPADLSRRSFLVGSAAAGLALGYSAVPGLVAPTRHSPRLPISIQRLVFDRAGRDRHGHLRQG